jgi:prepilin-type N-terminal cleavage/methylation domain-containing protein
MNSRGFSILELLIVVFLIGILAAIASPSFLGFSQRQRVRAATGLVYQALSLAKSNATTQKVDYSIDFRRDSDGFSYCVRSAARECSNWQSFRGVYFARCTFPSNGQNFTVTTLTIGSVCTARVSWTGSVQGRLGGVYLKPNSQSRYCRGVWTKTLLWVLDNREIDRCED